MIVQILKKIVVVILTIVIVLSGLLFLASQFSFLKVVEVSGLSMYPTFNDGDTLLMSKVPYMFDNDCKRDDVIVFEKNDTHYIKRVIGLPGETISIEDNNIMIDGAILDETFIEDDVDYTDMDGMCLGDNEYFVLGDNRANSADSRESYLGAISKDLIHGKILFLE